MLNISAQSLLKFVNVTFGLAIVADQEYQNAKASGASTLLQPDNVLTVESELSALFQAGAVAPAAPAAVAPAAPAAVAPAAPAAVAPAAPAAVAPAVVATRAAAPAAAAPVNSPQSNSEPVGTMLGVLR